MHFQPTPIPFTSYEGKREKKKTKQNALMKNYRQNTNSGKPLKWAIHSGKGRVVNNEATVRPFNYGNSHFGGKIQAMHYHIMLMERLEPRQRSTQHENKQNGFSFVSF